MEITACAVPPARPAPTGWPLAGRLIDALTRRDFGDLAACFHADVRLRALLPSEVLELRSAEPVAAKFEQWFGGDDRFEVLEATAGQIGPRQDVRWRIRMWPPDRPAESRVVEQHLLINGVDRAESLDLLCSGFHSRFDEATGGAR